MTHTDEEIIIDGVNVAGCDAYKDKHCKDKTSIIFCDTNLCSNYPYCYYKQLKRLEQENAELKAEIRQYKKYKFLFEKAKEFKEKSDKWAKKCLAENEDLKDTIKRTVCQAECFRYKQATKYKQTLQEIKSIVSNIIDGYIRPYGDYEQLKNILAIITKAEVGE